MIKLTASRVFIRGVTWTAVFINITNPGLGYATSRNTTSMGKYTLYYLQIYNENYSVKSLENKETHKSKIITGNLF